MKILTITLLFVGLTATGFADIQAPPSSHQTRIHKLGRGVSNILYGFTELPMTMIRTNEREGNTSAFGAGIVEGLRRSVVRVGFGFFEVATFPKKTYKDDYRAPYQNIEYDPYNGYSEFPPELGFQSKYRYGRKQTF